MVPPWTWPEPTTDVPGRTLAHILFLGYKCLVVFLLNPIQIRIMIAQYLVMPVGSDPTDPIVDTLQIQHQYIRQRGEFPTIPRTCHRESHRSSPSNRAARTLWWWSLGFLLLLLVEEVDMDMAKAERKDREGEKGEILNKKLVGDENDRISSSFCWRRCVGYCNRRSRDNEIIRRSDQDVEILILFSPPDPGERSECD